MIFAQLCAFFGEKKTLKYLKWVLVLRENYLCAHDFKVLQFAYIMLCLSHVTLFVLMIIALLGSFVLSSIFPACCILEQVPGIDRLSWHTIVVLPNFTDCVLL